MAPGDLPPNVEAYAAQHLARGYQDTTRGRLYDLHATLPDTGMPWWVGYPTYLEHVRGVLMVKDPAWYGPLWPNIRPAAGPQWWPAPDQPTAA
jgi:hypothetical protein